MFWRRCNLHFAPLAGRVLGVLILLVGFSTSFVQAALASPQGGGVADCSELYRVRYGDTLNSIANKFGVSVNDLLYANDIPVYGSRHVHPGDVLCIPESGHGGYHWSDAILNARVNSNRELQIWGRYFPENHDFVVRLDTGSWRLVKRLGETTSSNDGRIADTFTIPINWRGAPSFGVCLKDSSSNRYLCISVQNPYHGWNRWTGNWNRPPCRWDALKPGDPQPSCLSKDYAILNGPSFDQ